MGIANAVRKVFAFSSEKNRAILEGNIKDRATLERSNDSAIIEKALFSALFPQESNAAYFASSIYDGTPLALAYANAFGYLAAGLGWDAAYPNGKPLVEAFAKVILKEWPTLTGAEQEIHHLYQQLTSIVEMIPTDRSDKKLCATIIDELHSFPDNVYLTEILGVILRNWDMLGNHTRTYRALTDVARLAAPRFQDTALHRVQFIDALKVVSQGW